MCVILFVDGTDGTIEQVASRSYLVRLILNTNRCLHRSLNFIAYLMVMNLPRGMDDTIVRF